VTPTPLRVGISTCPNDTFAFHALLTGEVSDPELDLTFELLDVEELNRGLAAGRYDVAKGSFHAALHLTRELITLPVGAALGFGVGPVLLGRPGVTASPSSRVLCPGQWTTATLLWQLFHSGDGVVEQRPFHEIVPALTSGAADLGVCIHEARFTYTEHGLDLVEDLGTTWEGETGSPLPLGGLFARRDLSVEVTRRMIALIRDSLAWARSHPDAALVSMRAHAQEFEDDVLREHVELYVNDYTTDLGDTGINSLRVLHERAHDAGLLEGAIPPLEVFAG
jgi:1,4-dihydroxy-6-naphthoate synthase